VASIGTLLCVALAAVPLSWTEAHAQARDTVSVWNARCRQPRRIKLSLRLGNRNLYRGSIPVCRSERRSETGRIRFRFTADRPIVWYGYRSAQRSPAHDVGDTTTANTSFELDIWQAGGEADALLLGVSAAARDGLHMNTVCVVWVTKPSRRTLATGLVLEASRATGMPGPP